MITKDSLLELIASEVGEGYAVDNAGAVMASATTPFYGVVVRSDDPDGYSTIALAGYPGVVELKLHSTGGTIAKGDLLQMHTNGTFKKDLATGGRVVCAQALEAKPADSALIKARLLSTPLIGS